MKKSSSKLIMLGVIAVIIAIASTSVSIYVYHNSGDIYLDRSRPGFLSDEEAVKNDNVDNEVVYKFSDTESDITKDEIDEYLINFDEEVNKLNAIPDPYSLKSISDENLLNISSE